MESIEDAHGKIVRPGINMDIDINALDFDKKLIKNIWIHYSLKSLNTLINFIKCRYSIS